MCQLLGISSTAPTHYCHSMLEPFCKRGGNTDVHRHGWGLAYYNKKYRSNSSSTTMSSNSSISDSANNNINNDNDWNIINETNPAATSAYANEIINSRRHLETTNLICHIRYATVGDVSISNVHPFKKTLFGGEFVFAHNGDVPMFEQSKGKRKLNSLTDMDMDLDLDMDLTPTFRPIGETDSEYVFCTILNYLQSKFDTIPSLAELYVAIGEICVEIAQQQEGTILNFLLGFGEVIFAFSWPGARKGSTTWNGLHYTLKKDGHRNSEDSDSDLDSDSDSSDSGGEPEVAVITTKPLTDDSSWTEFQKGELILFVNGKIVSSANFYNVDRQ